jgi:hypothetical protein
MTLDGSELAIPIVLENEELQSNKVLDPFPRLLEAFGDNSECLGIVLINMTSVPEYPARGKHFFLILLISLFSLKRNFKNLKILMQNMSLAGHTERRG